MIDATGLASAERFRDEHPDARHPVDRSERRRRRGHWIPEEGRALEPLLAHLAAVGVRRRDVMVITSFRDVAHRIARLPAPPGLRGLRAGTIHTAQSKQAEIVILGSDPSSPAPAPGRPAPPTSSTSPSAAPSTA